MKKEVEISFKKDKKFNPKQEGSTICKVFYSFKGKKKVTIGIIVLNSKTNIERKYAYIPRYFLILNEYELRQIADKIKELKNEKEV
jgi:hypothetical protein